MTRELKPCGTLAAYKRHQRRGEVPCYACLDARNDVALAPSRRQVLAAAVYTGRPRRGTQRAVQIAQLRGAA
jgi:hypothetical protein